MKKLLFYCQHILGMGHLVRSMEIVRGLMPDFQVCFINGGQVVKEFQIPQGVEVINLPAIKTDAEFKQLQVVDSSLSLAEVQEIRKNRLLKVAEEFQPDVLMIELFPFGRGKFSFELIPLLEKLRACKKPVKIVSSLRDIVVTKTNRVKYEEKVCRLMNQYFDMLLIHGDSNFIHLDESFSRLRDIQCDTKYTGYVVQKVEVKTELSQEDKKIIESEQPLILVSVGGGRFGHDLIDCVIESADILSAKIPHHIQVFTGPFAPEAQLKAWQYFTQNKHNIKVSRYTPNLLSYMQKADLSISMSGYNTTLNVMNTGVRAMILPFKGNDDQEQRIRASKLDNLGVVKMLDDSDLQPQIFSEKVIDYLRIEPCKIKFDANGVENTAALIKNLVVHQKIA
ncbi:putative glycosyl transferase [Rivularia sp. PCC 7116]|uniref:glycosyltransferase family protein n=1 Tax=Rivularia sp. PCC 7116 TaxID=373994 RepID=UPI00029EE202|nr:glycosyltransferase [Rivularia sp. PCC 7116]AFY55428.1 putative glycosyl transferase [Rivularia sp. PCC 7116]